MLGQHRGAACPEGTHEQEKCIYHDATACADYKSLSEIACNASPQVVVVVNFELLAGEGTQVDDLVYSLAQTRPPPTTPTAFSEIF